MIGMLHWIDHIPTKGFAMQASQSGYWEVGVITASDVNRARSESLQAWASVEAVEGRLSHIVKRETQLNKNINKYDIVRQMRQFCDAWTTRAGATVILMLGATLNDLVVCHFLGVPTIFWAITTVVVLSSTGFCGIWLFRPDDTKLDSDMDSWSRELRSLSDQKAVTEQEASQARARFDKLESAYKKALKQFESRINRLRSANWQLMQGVPFENFLAEIFREWGFDVETTKTTGDQGVDLIACKAGLRIAIQAKGYPRTTVGNGAVQEAHTGMKFYRCQRCAVITNSTFTSSARQLAAAVGCSLIDGSMIPSLIEGQIRL
jgi:hypothetical protein